MRQTLLLHYKKNVNTKGEYSNMTHKHSTGNTNTANTVNTVKSNTQNSQSQNANTESYCNLMNTMEYYSVLGFLLSRMAYEITHEKQMSD